MVSTPHSKQLVVEYFKALSGNKKTPELVGRYVTDAGLAEHIQQSEAAFPCYALIPEEIVAEGDVVAVRGLFRGCHQGAFAGIEATGRQVEAPLAIFYRVANGRIVEHWLHFDTAALMEQIAVATPA